PLFTLFLVLSSEQFAKSQTQHLSVLITGNSEALAKPLWDFDIESIERVVTTLVSDPVVQRVNVRDTSGLFDITKARPGI
ncbi:MAG: hypothetical protein JZU55_08820, partial [Afipia sp.]|nr:hypothetical protein [Afipia sp.]